MIRYDQLDPKTRALVEQQCGGGGKRSKYRAVRTEYRGRVYDSKAEAQWAKELDWRKEIGVIAWWIPQVKITLDHEAKYTLRVDFVVAFPLVGGGVDVEAHDVKGAEPKDWPRTKRMWAAHGPFALKIIRGGKVAEVINPAERA